MNFGPTEVWEGQLAWACLACQTDVIGDREERARSIIEHLGWCLVVKMIRAVRKEGISIFEVETELRADEFKNTRALLEEHGTAWLRQEIDAVSVRFPAFEGISWEEEGKDWDLDLDFHRYEADGRVYVRATLMRRE